MIAFAESQSAPTYAVNATDLLELRNSWCGSTTVRDNRYNETEKYYYRYIRQGVFADQTTDAFRFYQEYNAYTWIQSQRWATGLLLVLVILTFITMIVFVIMCCVGQANERSNKMMRFCFVLSWVLFILFIGIFVVVMIFIAFSEVGQRRSKCQILNVGNMLVNGYTNNQNGNNYIGMVTLNKAIQSLRGEFQSLLPAIPAAQSILASNLNVLTQSANTALLNVFLFNNANNTVGAFREVSRGYSLMKLTPTVSPAIGAELNSLTGVSNALNNAAQAITVFANTNNDQVHTQTLSQMNSVVQNLINDIGGSTLALYNMAWTRYQYATGGYWALFALSLAIIIVVGIMLACLGNFWNENNNNSSKTTLFNVLLAILAFFVLWYGICVIILLAGSTSISTFCTVLSQLNQGNTQLIDSLPIKWQPNPSGNTKAVLKECALGNTGNILNFVNSMSAPNTFNATAVDNVQQLIKGLIGYRAWIASPQSVNSPAVSVYISNLVAISQGAIEDTPSVYDQKNLINDITNNSPINDITTYLCNANATTASTCFASDRLLSNSGFFNNANYTKILPYYMNIQGYILSEQAAMVSLINQMNATSQSPNSLINAIVNTLASNQNNFNTLSTYLPTTLANFKTLNGGLNSLDCRNINIELNILEDKVCFQLNFWVFILTVITAVSFILLFAMMWSLCAAARHTNSTGVVSAMPEPYRKEDPALDINDREIIPSM